MTQEERDAQWRRDSGHWTDDEKRDLATEYRRRRALDLCKSSGLREDLDRHQHELRRLDRQLRDMKVDRTSRRGFAAKFTAGRLTPTARTLAIAADRLAASRMPDRTCGALQRHETAHDLQEHPPPDSWRIDLTHALDFAPGAPNVRAEHCTRSA